MSCSDRPWCFPIRGLPCDALDSGPWISQTDAGPPHLSLGARIGFNSSALHQGAETATSCSPVEISSALPLSRCTRGWKPLSHAAQSRSRSLRQLPVLRMPADRVPTRWGRTTSGFSCSWCVRTPLGRGPTSSSSSRGPDLPTGTHFLRAISSSRPSPG